VTTSESSSLELARLRRKSLPATPDGRSVREEAQRFKELEDRLDKPVDHQRQTDLKDKELKDKEVKDKLKENQSSHELITLQDKNPTTDEAAASALLQIAHETSKQLGRPNEGQELDSYTPLTKAALEVFDLQSMQHMNEKELAKQKLIRDQRIEKERAALEAEAKGLHVKDIDERLMVSPTGRQNNPTVAVLQSHETIPEVNKNIDEDEHISRLVQDNKDDSQSVRSFGKRTEIAPQDQANIKLKKVVPFDGPLKIAIQKYVGDYEGLWPLLLEPDGEFQVDEGQIPCPLELGNVGRRMVSVMDTRDMPSVHHWDAVSYRDKFITREQMVLSYEVYLIAK
jgi:hypothetical protein